MLCASSIGAYVDQCEWLERATAHREPSLPSLANGVQGFRFLFIEPKTQAALYNTVASLGRKVTALNRVATDQELRSSCPGTRPLGGESASRTCIPETSCPVGRQPFLSWDTSGLPVTRALPPRGRARLSAFPNSESV